VAQAIPIHADRFPKSYAYLQTNLPQVSARPQVWNPFIECSGLTQNEAAEAIRWGTSPWVFASSLNSAWALFNQANPGRIEVNTDVLTHFEGDSSAAAAQEFLLAKVLHELCHWGCFRKQVQETEEQGERFENLAFGQHLRPWWLQSASADSATPEALSAASLDTGVFTDPKLRAAACRQLASGAAHVPGRREDPSHATFSGADVSEPLPRGIRNNNPGNIKKGTDDWLGLARPDQMAPFQLNEAVFYVFREPEWGMRAMVSLLRAYKRKHGLVTPRGIISRYAPAGDNNNVQSYATALANGLGIGIDDVADADDNSTVLQMIKAMIRHENGTKILYSETQYRTAMELL